MSNLIRRITMLLLGLAGLVCFLFAANRLSSEFTLVDRNRQAEIEADAYFYSEVGDLSEFLDDEKGKYGRNSLNR